MGIYIEIIFRVLQVFGAETIHSCGYAQQQHRFQLSGLAYTMSNCPYHLLKIRWKAKSLPNEQELQIAALQAWQTFNRHKYQLLLSTGHRFLWVFSSF